MIIINTDRERDRETKATETDKRPMQIKRPIQIKRQTREKVETETDKEEPIIDKRKKKLENNVDLYP